MNEIKLIQRIRSKASRHASVVVGIGDDAASVREQIGTEMLLKADMIVEGVHFTRASRPRDWGWKAVASNVSDIAAMGGEPRFALISVGLPRNFPMRDALEIHRGAEEALGRFGAALVGGDTCRSEKIVISVALTGVVRKGRAVTRAGARAGDIVFATGPLGGSLRSGKHLRFTPRLAESRYLVSRYTVSAMIDVSDGLSKDLRHLAEESRVGLVIYASAVRLAPGARTAEDAFRDGEDFELIFTMKQPEALRLCADARAARLGFDFYPIGRVVLQRKGLRLIGVDGRDGAFPKTKDHHFA